MSKGKKKKKVWVGWVGKSLDTDMTFGFESADFKEDVERDMLILELRHPIYEKRLREEERKIRITVEEL